MIKNCPFNASDVTNSTKIFGPDLACIRGETVRRKPERVEANYMEIPKDFYKLHKFITLVGDVMFVNKIPSFITMSRKIRMMMAEHTPSRTAPSLAKSLIKVLQLYAKGGFGVRTVMMDMEFKNN